MHEAYNPLQKHAYTSAIGLGVLSVLTGLAVWKPVQFSLAGVADGWISLGALVAFCRDVGDFGIRTRASGHGAAAWME